MRTWVQSLPTRKKLKPWVPHRAAKTQVRLGNPDNNLSKGRGLRKPLRGWFEALGQ